MLNSDADPDGIWAGVAEYREEKNLVQIRDVSCWAEVHMCQTADERLPR
jgi:hypothetical protein